MTPYQRPNQAVVLPLLRGLICGAGLLGVLLVLLTGCSRSLKIDNPYVGRLSNQGLVALSDDNPYLAGNLLLSKESESSLELRGFIEHKGQPSALEVKKTMFSPVTVELYYPDAQEYFTVEEVMGTWAIRGPFPLSSLRLRDVLASTNRLHQDIGEPLRDLPLPLSLSPAATSTGRAGFSSPAPRERTEEIPDLRREFDLDAPVREERRPPVASRRDETAPLQSYLKQAENKPAERSPRGDLVHYVSFRGETIAMIAQWYTYESSNATKIARINRLAIDTPLREGDTIVIPSYLVRNPNRIPEEAVRTMRIISEGSSSPAERYSPPPPPENEHRY